ncbi:MAG: hypothetical protein IJK18_08095 [Clostridia bacterium]|nr:hypothetical protein [Clostridia bacterium]
MEWYSYVVAVILLISSVVSPWLVNKENNKHQLKLKKIEIYELSKRNALENFIKASSSLYNSSSLGLLDKFYDSINCLYIFFNNVPDGLSSLIDLRNENHEDFFNELNNYIRVLSQEIDKE